MRSDFVRYPTLFAIKLRKGWGTQNRQPQVLRFALDDKQRELFGLAEGLGGG